jgi:hypothetical protein
MLRIKPFFDASIFCTHTQYPTMKIPTIPASLKRFPTDTPSTPKSVYSRHFRLDTEASPTKFPKTILSQTLLAKTPDATPKKQG